MLGRRGWVAAKVNGGRGFLTSLFRRPTTNPTQPSRHQQQHVSLNPSALKQLSRLLALSHTPNASGLALVSALADAAPSGALALANQVQITQLATALRSSSVPPADGLPWEDPQLPLVANALASRCLEALSTAVRTNHASLFLPPAANLAPAHHAVSDARLAHWLWWAALDATVPLMRPRDICVLYFGAAIPTAMGYHVAPGVLPDTSDLTQANACAWTALLAQRLDVSQHTSTECSATDASSAEGVSAFSQWLHSTSRADLMSRCFEAVPLGLLGHVVSSLAALNKPQETLSLLRCVLGARVHRSGLQQFQRTELAAFDAMAAYHVADGRSNPTSGIVADVADWVQRVNAELGAAIPETGALQMPASRSDINADIFNERSALATSIALIVLPALHQFARHGDTANMARVAYAAFSHIAAVKDRCLSLSYGKEREAFVASLIKHIGVCVVNAVLHPGAPMASRRVTVERLQRAIEAFSAVFNDLDDDAHERLVLSLTDAASRLPGGSATDPPRRRQRAVDILKQVTEHHRSFRVPVGCYADILRCSHRDAEDGESPWPLQRVVDIVRGALSRAPHFSTRDASATIDLFVAATTCAAASASCGAEEYLNLVLLFKGTLALEVISLRENVTVRAAVAVALLRAAEAVSSPQAAAKTGELYELLGIPNGGSPIDAVLRVGDGQDRALASVVAFLTEMRRVGVIHRWTDGHFVAVCAQLRAAIESMLPAAAIAASTFRGTLYDLLADPSCVELRTSAVEGNEVLRATFKAMLSDEPTPPSRDLLASAEVVVVVTESVVKTFNGVAELSLGPLRSMAKAALGIVPQSNQAKPVFCWTPGAALELLSLLRRSGSSNGVAATLRTLGEPLNASHCILDPSVWTRDAAQLYEEAHRLTSRQDEQSPPPAERSSFAAVRGVAECASPSLRAVVCWKTAALPLDSAPSDAEGDDGMHTSSQHSTSKHAALRWFASRCLPPHSTFVAGDDRTVHALVASTQLSKRSANAFRGAPRQTRPLGAADAKLKPPLPSVPTVTAGRASPLSSRRSVGA